MLSVLFNIKGSHSSSIAVNLDVTILILENLENITLLFDDGGGFFIRLF